MNQSCIEGLLAERIAAFETAFESLDWLEIISTDSEGIELLLADNEIKVL